MFNKIMVPVDLRHVPRLERELSVAAKLAETYGAPVTYVGVTGPEPGDLAHNPAEYRQKLQDFAATQASAHGHKAEAHVIVANDPATDLDKRLTHAVDEVGADLVVMATHIPNVTDYIWSSHGGYLANHAKASVFLVRG